MKQVIRYSMIGALCIGLFACSAPKQEDNNLEVIPIEAAFANQQELKASDYFRKVRYVRLETSDSCLIGGKPTVRISGDKLIINAVNAGIRDQCYAFDKNTGRFIAPLGHIGNDPQGALNLDGWINDASGRIYFSAGDAKYVVYDLEGNFQGRITYPDKSKGFFGQTHFSYLDKDVCVTHSLSSGNKPERILLFNDSVKISQFDFPYDKTDSISGDAGSILSIHVLSPLAGKHLLMHIFYKDQKQAVFNMTTQPFWRVQDKLYFKREFNDTIYQVTEQGLYPERRFDFGSLRWDRQDRLDPEKDEAAYPVDVFENEHFVFLRFVLNLLHREKWEAYNVFYNKKNGEVKVSPFEDGITNDLNHFMPLQPTTQSASGEWAQIIQAEKVVEWFEEQDDISNLLEEIQALRQTDPDDNPIVAIME